MKYALTAIAVAAMASSQAAIIIDHFNDPAGGQSATIFSPGNGAYLATGNVGGLTDVIGGYRQIYVGTQTATGRSRIQAAANLTPDYFTLATDSVSIDGYAGVKWYGASQTSGLNADLSECKLIRFDYDNDQQTKYILTLTTYGGATHSESVTEGMTSFGTDVFWLWKFAAAGVDLANVDEIELKADPLAGGGDVSVHLVECDIPEPTTTGVAFAALAGIGMVVRRFRKA